MQKAILFFENGLLQSFVAVEIIPFSSCPDQNTKNEDERYGIDKHKQP
jgi:hypothetical protein